MSDQHFPQNCLACFPELSDDFFSSVQATNGDERPYNAIAERLQRKGPGKEEGQVEEKRVGKKKA